MTISELLEKSMVSNPQGDLWSKSAFDISPRANFKGPLILGDISRIGDVVVGRYCELDDYAVIEDASYLGEQVELEDNVRVGHHTTLFNGVRVGAESTLLDRVIIGPGVKLSRETQLGNGTIVPSAKTIMSLGRLGTSERNITIHGSDDGPCYSTGLGCQYSVRWERFHDRIMRAEHTSKDSADHYREYLDILQSIGDIVQRHYQAESGLIQDLRGQAAELRTQS